MGLPSRGEWVLAARRAAVLVGSAVGYGVANGQLGNLGDWLYGRGWAGANHWIHGVLSPIDFAVFLTVLTGLTWTVGRLLVQSSPAARGSFRSMGLALTAAARRRPALARKALPWLPGLAAAGIFLGRSSLTYLLTHTLGPNLVGLTVVLLTSYALCRKRAEELAVAPPPPDPELADDPDPAAAALAAVAARSDDSFAAVAVTPRTKGIVGAASLGTLGMVLATLFASMSALSGPAGLSLLAYAGLMLAVPVALRRSRMVVGIDGILVLGADSPRFLAYADHDEVRHDNGDILLLRRGAVRARLQLDDADRVRAPKLVLRLRSAMSLAAKMAEDGADHAVRPLLDGQGGSEALAGAARGTDYRRPALIRENLWALVEGPLSDADTRLLVAEALTHDLREGERPRLRVAAKACAEPRVRLAMERLAGEEPGEAIDDTEEPEAARLRLTR